MDMLAVRTPDPDQSELAIARRVAAGDANAFEPIMRRHNRMLYRIARSILGEDAEAEDCLQSAYLLAFRSIASFNGRAKLSTWLARIVINEALGRKRRAARERAIVSVEGAADSEAVEQGAAPLAAGIRGPESEAMRRQLGALIERRVDALPEAFRGVFVLRAFEELSVDEVSELLGVPEATVRTRYFRARGLLRESLAQDLDGAFDEEAFAFAGGRCDRIVSAVLARLGCSATRVGRGVPEPLTS
jgi:RNA polymerase sigma-70 factor (ECF subfamily)